MPLSYLAVTLFLIFLVMKLVHVIAWSWVWVLSPLWIPVALFIVLVVLLLVFGLLAKLF